MSESPEVKVHFETTPNPQSLKFTVNTKIADETADFKQAQDTHRSPLAAKIFGFPWTDGVYIGTDYVTVTKQDWVEWDVLAEPLSGLIQEHVSSGSAVLHSQEAQAPQSDDSPLVQKIKKVLNEEVRPAVALDGGDIVFSHYENGIVYLYMQGACAGCPSSSVTLKMGIETRLQEAIPEIKEVIAL